MSHKLMVMDEELFRIDLPAKEAFCLKCDRKITDLRKFSYYRHYKKMHKEIARDFGLLNDEDDENDGEPTRKIPKIEVRMDECTLTSSLVELLTVNGLPLNLLRYPAFLRIIRPIEEGLKMSLHLNPETIKPILRRVSTQIQKQIIADITGIFICLKLDLATRMNRESICGNIFVREKKIK